MSRDGLGEGPALESLALEKRAVGTLVDVSTEWAASCPRRGPYRTLPRGHEISMLAEPADRHGLRVGLVLIGPSGVIDKPIPRLKIRRVARDRDRIAPGDVDDFKPSAIVRRWKLDFHVFIMHENLANPVARDDEFAMLADR